MLGRHTISETCPFFPLDRVGTPSLNFTVYFGKSWVGTYPDSALHTGLHVKVGGYSAVGGKDKI